MSIKANVGQGVISVGTSDTTIIAPSSTIDRYHITALSVHNTNASSVTISFYVSPNLTTASGVLVINRTLAAGAEDDINNLIGHGFPAGSSPSNIIAVASATGVNALATITEYDGGD